MEFDKSKVYTALNAEELKVGYKCIFANNIDSLKCKVEEGTDIRPIVQILNDAYERRFKTDVPGEYPFAYLVSEEIWIVYICRHKGVEPYLTACRSDKWESVKEEYGAKTKLFEGTDDECEEWYTFREHLADVIAAWEDGKTIQFLENSTGNWIITGQPGWSTTTQYRIKPESLKWTDLKIGDVIHEKNGTQTRMVICIDTSNELDGDGDICHLCLGDWWITDEELKNWEKVE